MKSQNISVLVPCFFANYLDLDHTPKRMPSFEASTQRDDERANSCFKCSLSIPCGAEGGRVWNVNANKNMTDNLNGASAAAELAPLADVAIKRLDKELPLPHRAHRGDAGADLYAAEAVTLQPGERALVGTGIAIALPLGTVGLIHPRSGLAAKQGLSVVNTPGTVDADYRGEIKVCLINHDQHEAIEITRGMRIAQLVIQRVELVDFVEVEELDDTTRGAGGYGSTGV